jgi:hypothetical protein
MTDPPSFGTPALVLLAFVSRSGALVCLLLLSRYFWRANGPLVMAFRVVWAAFSFLLAWVWIASVAELVGYIRGASALVELSSNFIFVPNLVIFFALLALLIRLHHGR